MIWARTTLTKALLDTKPESIKRLTLIALEMETLLRELKAIKTHSHLKRRGQSEAM